MGGALPRGQRPGAHRRDARRAIRAARRLAPDRHRDRRELIGDIAVRVDADEPRQATVGFTLAADAQGHGYATEALRTVISLLFTQYSVHRICADCDTRNHRSVALLERIGMRREAHHHKSAWWKGEWTDEYVYALLAEEWPDETTRGE